MGLAWYFSVGASLVRCDVMNLPYPTEELHLEFHLPFVVGILVDVRY